MLNLPFDINVIILSFLPSNNLEYLSIKSLIPKNLMRVTLNYKFNKVKSKIIKGITNNFYNECFICSKNLGSIYNIIFCYYCTLTTEDYQIYPIICHKCSKEKLKRGKIIYTYCDICNHPTTHLGITPFS
jgi:hypothetical protein